jgi:hypothetical protein
MSRPPQPPWFNHPNNIRFTALTSQSKLEPSTVCSQIEWPRCFAAVYVTHHETWTSERTDKFLYQ